MAVVHTSAELTPSKSDLLEAWLPRQPWWPEGAAVPAAVASFRFDDPAGEVGIETFLLPLGDVIAHVPVTYRAQPLDGAVLIGEMQHSALGPRWAYDAPTDPVYIAEATAVIREGRGEVDLVGADGTPLPRRATTASVHGSGDGEGLLHVERLVPAATPAVGTLTATWAEHSEPVVLAWLG